MITNRYAIIDDNITKLQIDSTKLSQVNLDLCEYTNTHPLRLICVFDLWNNGMLTRIDENWFVITDFSNCRIRCTIEHYNTPIPLELAALIIETYPDTNIPTIELPFKNIERNQRESRGVRVELQWETE